jgi:hypothetical protein
MRSCIEVVLTLTMPARNETMCGTREEGVVANDDFIAFEGEDCSRRFVVFLGLGLGAKNTVLVEITCRNNA